MKTTSRMPFVIAAIAAMPVALFVGCASPLTIAEPRDGGAALGNIAFPETGTLEEPEAGPDSFLADPPDDASDG